MKSLRVKTCPVLVSLICELVWEINGSNLWNKFNPKSIQNEGMRVLTKQILNKSLTSMGVNFGDHGVWKLFDR